MRFRYASTLLGFLALVACGDTDKAATAIDVVEAFPSEPPALSAASRALSLDPIGVQLARPNPQAFVADGDGFVSPGWRATAQKDFSQLAARLPITADAPIEISLGRIGRFKLIMTPIGAAPVRAREHSGRLVYPDAYSSTDVVWLSTDSRAEELLYLRDSSAPTEFNWTIRLGNGMVDIEREASGAIAFVDPRGEAVLRIPRPFAVDANGSRRDLDLIATKDRISIRLDAAGLAYPLLVDPAVETAVWVSKGGGGPVGRLDTAMGYTAGGVLVYGGVQAGASCPLSDTWRWDGLQWSMVSKGDFSGWAYGHAIGESETSLIAWMDSRAKTGCGSYYRSIRKWDGHEWQTIKSWGSSSEGGPGDIGMPSYVTSRLAWDAARGVWAMAVTSFYEPNYLWKGYQIALSGSGTNWTPGCISPACTNGTPALFEVGLTYVPGLSGPILYAGKDYATNTARSNTWLWNGADWSLLSASGPAGHVVASGYDNIRNRVIAIAGATWEFDGTNWTPVGSTPAGGVAFAYDRARHRGVLLTTTNTWEYHVRGNTCTLAGECDTGYCVDGVCCESASCGPCRACDTAANPGVCATVANAEDDTCNGTKSCDGTGVCKSKAGTSCTAASECLTGYCVDTVCCDSPCTGTCQACSADLKSSGESGICGYAKADSDPHDQCTDETGTSTCGHDGSCDGSGACRYVSKGTACGAASCAGNTLTGKVCDGLGKCDYDPVGKVCAPYMCLVDHCADPCSTKSDCLPGNYCNAGVCSTTTGPGAACSTHEECTTGHCADGVCCNTACSGLCLACTLALKGGGQDGECGPIGEGSDPQEECAPSEKSTCGLDGTCNGLGGCRRWQMGTPCGGSTCDSNYAVGQICDGQGNCKLNTNGVDCSPYVCVSGGCANPCADSSQCIFGRWCDSGTCKPKTETGLSCPANGACKSGYCVDGVCCESDCTGRCVACSAAKKGSGIDGACAPVSDKTDPDDECATEALKTCGQDGTCNGKGACRLYDQGTSIGASQCVGPDSSVKQVCDGAGSPVIDTANSSCKEYTCNPNTGECRTSCNSSAECSSTGKYACVAGACVPKKVQGDQCSDDSQCETGHCADGFCCNTSCDQTCERCNGGVKGICTPVTAGSAPETSRPPCKGAGTTCAGACDGITSGCVYPGGTTSCLDGWSCSASVEVPVVCDGQGTCKADKARNCFPFSCDAVGKQCAKQCVSDSDCATGAECNPSTHQCASTDNTCKDDFTIKSPGGAESSCAPYKCNAGVCRDACSTANDCAGGYGCVGSKCTLTADGGEPTTNTSVEQDKGCGCQTVGSSGASAKGALIALLAFGLVHRRRKGSLSSNHQHEGEFR